jgi:hypothetical protein
MLKLNRHYYHLFRYHSTSGIPIDVETKYRCLHAVFVGYLVVFCEVLAAISKTLFAESHYLHCRLVSSASTAF